MLLMHFAGRCRYVFLFGTELLAKGSRGEEMLENCFVEAIMLNKFGCTVGDKMNRLDLHTLVLKCDSDLR